MGSHLIIDGNAVYEVDEDCMLALERVSKNPEEKKNKDTKKPIQKNRKQVQTGFLKNDL